MQKYGNVKLPRGVCEDISGRGRIRQGGGEALCTLSALSVRRVVFTVLDLTVYFISLTSKKRAHMYTHKIPCKPRPRALYIIASESVMRAVEGGD